MPENQIAWNSSNHRIKETVKQNHQTWKGADGEKSRWGSGPWRQGWLLWGSRLPRRGWLKGKLRLRGGCGLVRLPQWEKLPVSHESSLKSGLDRDKQASCSAPSRAPPPQAALQHRWVALPRYIPQAPSPWPTNLSGAWNKEIGPKWKKKAKPQKES